MRTTVSLDPDIEAEVERLRRDDGLGLSEAINLLARRGLARSKRPTRYVHRSVDMGMKIDVTNIGEVLDLLDN